MVPVGYGKRYLPLGAMLILHSNSIKAYNHRKIPCHITGKYYLLLKEITITLSYFVIKEFCEGDNMTGKKEIPKVFISYSWSSVKHEQWVLELAERLMSDGIWIVLDKWDLKEGQDKYKFMEQMVTDSGINNVLVICDKTYQTKASLNEGGVGTESQIISKKMYEDTGQSKFIPIVTELDENNQPYLPLFMDSRMYLDFSSEEIFEHSYEKLLRNLYNRPSLKRPPLGVPPLYLFDDEPVIIKTANYASKIKYSLQNSPKAVNGLLRDYVADYFISLEDFRITRNNDAEFDEQVIESIQKLLPLRDSFINIVISVYKYYDGVDNDIFYNFFQELISYKHRPHNISTWRENDFDNYQFFIYELFLYFITVLLKLGKYAEASYFIHSVYFFRYDNSGQLHASNIAIFYAYVPTLDDIRNRRLSLNRISVTADTVKQRAIYPDISFETLIDTEIILYFITSLQFNDDYYNIWFPRCSLFFKRERPELFEKAISKSHFEKIKVLFKVKDGNEFIELVANAISINKQQSLGFDYRRVPSLQSMIDMNNIAKL
ncbi:MAG: hypothetical protein VR69_09445 [Peptococcaceae bacterium BRH_c4b]|nr:MAG: hypothetical protein VR69_09445 [Peptococcaceae bacterium BRH_c4b]